MQVRAERVEDDRPAAVPRTALPVLLRSGDQPARIAGNPLLDDSKLFNAEARYEWYFDADQRLSVAGFYKKIDNPIEAFVAGARPDHQPSPTRRRPSSTAPSSRCRNTSISDDWGGLAGSAARCSSAATTPTPKSKLKVAAERRHRGVPRLPASTLATDYFQDGAPLTGQSEHIANLQIGLENRERLSQQTILVTYASERTVSRGLNGTPAQPDVIEIARPPARFRRYAKGSI